MENTTSNDSKNRTVIVVVGVHRSGTSLVSRAMQALGINLGDRLSVEPAEDNAKGHWEDKDVVALNDQVLAATGMEWDSTRKVNHGLFETPSFEPLTQKALHLIDERFRDADIWSFKDPRTSRLLPFWLDAFARRELDVRFVWVIRNPLAVASSLEKRNLFSDLRAHLLWLSYNLSLREWIGASRCVVVDYDRLLDATERELDRIASGLGLSASDRDVAEFAADFADRELSHANFTEDEAVAGHGMALLAGRAYAWLAQVARSEVDLDDSDRHAVWTAIEEEYEQYSGISDYVDSRESLLKAQLADTRNLVENSNAEFNALTKVVANLRASLESAGERQDQRVERLSSEFEEAKQQLRERVASGELERDGLRRQLSASELERGSLQGQVAASESEREGLREQLVASEVQRETNAKLVNQKESEQRQLQEMLDGVTSELSKVELRLESSDKKLSTTVALLNHERYSVVKPLFRRLYRGGANAVFRMPRPVQHFARRMKRKLYPRTVALYEASGMENAAAYSDEARTLLLMAIAAKTEKFDVFVFPVIDWHFRFQRPQHLAKKMAERGHRVFYLATTFGAGSQPDFQIVESPFPGVFIAQLVLPGRLLRIYEDVPNGEEERCLASALRSLAISCEVAKTVSLVDLPFWRALAQTMPGNLLVYDCMDYHGGFTTNSEQMLQEEHFLLEQADLTITTSERLSRIVAETVKNTVIRNGGDIDYFKTKPKELAYETSAPVVGYLGAIAEWFDIELIAEAARRYPDWSFVLVGSTHLCDVSEVRTLSNVELIGEVPYDQAASWVHSFDVAMIPFKITELTLCTNPVKAYEYLAAGKPVVSTALPEVQLMDDMVHVAVDGEDFVEQLSRAMDQTDDRKLAAKRTKWASRHDWSSRAHDLEQAIAGCFPMVSVVVLTYNNLEFTKACLDSLEAFTGYPNWELIVVDNKSGDDTPKFLKGYAASRPNLNVILNDENTGFAAGNNIGLAAAAGEYLIILNNDTFVTQGWMLDLVRHLKDSNVGLVGPVTNNIGNEAKIDVGYTNMGEMASAAYEYTSRHSRQLLDVRTLAFFGVAMSRQVYAKVGPLDEDFGRGFFEDDDYCNRVRQAGYRVAVAEDVFVHHHLSASFGELDDSVRKELFEKNKAIYEKKWGEWIPHRYREG